MHPTEHQAARKTSLVLDFSTSFLLALLFPGIFKAKHLKIGKEHEASQKNEFGAGFLTSSGCAISRYF